jgi:hypothetical protein
MREDLLQYNNAVPSPGNDHLEQALSDIKKKRFFESRIELCQDFLDGVPSMTHHSHWSSVLLQAFVTLFG